MQREKYQGEAIKRQGEAGKAKFAPAGPKLPENTGVVLLGGWCGFALLC